MSTEDTGAIAPTTITTAAAAPETVDPVWGETTIRLLFPLDFSGAKISAITLREPNLEQLEEIETKTDGQRNMAMMRITLAILSGVDPEALKKLNPRDFKALAEAAGPLVETLAASAGDKTDGDKLKT